mgnify:CR=1 FL=1
MDFEQWPDEHCVKSQELMRQAGVEEAVVRATASHGWGLCVDINSQMSAIRPASCSRALLITALSSVLSPAPPQPACVWTSSQSTRWKRCSTPVTSSLVSSGRQLFNIRIQPDVCNSPGVLFLSASNHSVATASSMAPSLIGFVKGRRERLSLKVYQKNRWAVKFYLSERFYICGEGIDGDTGEAEYTMEWKMARETYGYGCR